MKTSYFLSATPVILLFALGLLPGLSVVQGQDKPDEIMQKEVIRRSELLLRANKSLSEAEALIQQGKDAEARTKIDDTLATVPSSGDGKAVYERASAIRSILELRDAETKYAQKDYFAAREHALKALEYNKGNKSAEALLAKCNSALGIPKGSDKPSNPAVDPKFVSNLNKVQENIDLARDYMTTGNYDAADERLKAALAIDPYNKAAAAEQLKVQKKIRAAMEQATKTSRQEKLTETREGWMEKYKVENALDDKPIGTPIPIKGKTNFAVNQKLQSILIPKVDFNDATIDDAVKFLSLKTRELDETGAGVNFLIRSEKARTEAKNFNLKLKNVPAAEVLRYICSLAGVKFKVEEFAVFIVPLSENDQVLVSRDFPVRESFFDVEAPADSATPAPARRRTPTTVDNAASDPIKDALVARGVQFPEGAAALYNNATGILTVRNTQDQIDLVEELVTENQGETLLVRVETRLVEIKQKDLDSLAFNYNLAGSSTGPLTGALASGTQFAAGDISAGTNLLGSNGINESDGINRIINLDPASGSAANPVSIQSTPNRFGINGVLDGNAFGALLESLSQKEGTDLVTAPSILVNDGSQGTVEVAREFYYPTEFDQAQASVELTLSGSISVIDTTTTQNRRVTIVPSWPTSFEKRNVGVTLNVQPRVTVDRKRIYLTIKPDIVEFDGFINYGSRIFGDSVVVDNVVVGEPPVLNDNVINQPVFSVRTVENAQLEIQDGYTMVLGGLIREDISTVEDKVPFLGDLPLVGRLFRSKAEQSVKNNLLIFVTVRILRPDGEPFNVGSSKVAGASVR